MTRLIHRRRLGKADLHIHTEHSDGKPSVRAVLDHVARRGRLQVIAITDHDTVEGAQAARAAQSRYPFEIVVGEEVSSRDGHILALYIEERVQPRMSAAETIAAIHEQGGLAIAAHPFITTFGDPVQGIGRRFASLPFDAVEVENCTPFMYWANYRARRHNRRTRRLAEVGNSDAHIVEAIGKGFTRFAGKTAQDLRQAILNGRTSAHASNYGPRELLAYGTFYLDSLRPTRAMNPSLE